MGSPGYGFTITAIVSATIMGIVVLSFNRMASVQSSVFTDQYTASQAHWSALSGIQFGLMESIEGVYDDLGAKPFFLGDVDVDTSDTDDDGSALPEYWTRFTSQATVVNAERRLRFLAVISMRSVWGDVSIIEGTGDFDIGNNATLNDSLYIGQNITIATSASIGESPNDATHIYYPSAKSMTVNGSHPNLTYGQHRYDELFIPTFDGDPYDSLLTTAASSGTGNLRFRKNSMDTLDLTTYPDSTLYCSGTVSVEGVYIKGGTLERPGIIAASNTITLRAKQVGANLHQVRADDNVILVSGVDIFIQDSTYFGEDHTSELPQWSEAANLAFAKRDIRLQDEATLWGQWYAADDIQILATGYGIAYAPQRFTFSSADGYFEGAIFAAEYFGNSGLNYFDVGQLNLTYHYHEEWFKTQQLGFSDRTLREY